jgi:DNA-binding Lrp family transcriptional regulator
MTKLVTLDDTDRRIVCALQIHARASWQLIGSVLGLSDRTVARRVTRLRESGALSFVALLDETRCQLGSTMHLTATAAPAATMAVAAAVARRDDVRYVVTCAGSADLILEAVVADREAQHNLLDVELPAIPGMGTTTSHIVLRTYTTVAGWNIGLLEDNQVARLRTEAGSPPPDGATYQVDPDEIAIAAAFARDGRASLGAIAERVRLSEPTVRRRIERMVSGGALHFRAEMEPRLLGFTVEAELRLAVPYDILDTSARLLAAHPAVRYVGATAGPHNLSVEVAFADHDGLYEFLTAVLPATGATATNINLISRTVKRAGLIKRDGLYASA